MTQRRSHVTFPEDRLRVRPVEVLAGTLLMLAVLGLICWGFPLYLASHVS